MSMDYESWRCKYQQDISGSVEGNPINYCPPEGCSKGECVRDMITVEQLTRVRDELNA